ncbi:MAG: pirin family protein [Burkholderiales bacterium]|nr:pirin family protein [Burkholderiales bacterium]MDQ3196860.1 pirin family protein [Pseudomonadota bacterium]
MKQLVQIKPAPKPHWVGDGFPVRSLISIDGDARQTSPFLMLDYARPHEFAPASAPRGVGGHPHRGFETVTIAYQGEVAHRDSSGNRGLIRPGDVQWMTAASGVLHDEFHSEEFTREGGTFEMAQLWVNLPARDKMRAPRYQSLLDAEIPAVALPDNAGRLRVIAGDYEGTRGPAATHTPMNVWDVRLNAAHGATFVLPEGWSTVLVVLHGEIEMDGRKVGPSDTAHFSRDGNSISVRATENTIALLLSGEPIDEPIAHYGPFVMNTSEELQKAVADFNDGRFGALRV